MTRGFESVHAGMRDVEQHEVGMSARTAACSASRPFAASPDDFDAVASASSAAQALAREGFVVNYECFHEAQLLWGVELASGRRTVTTYSPPPGRTTSSPRCPKWYSMRARMFASA